MNYMGSKERLITPLIERAMATLDMGGDRFLDAFAGTHAVGRHMQGLGHYEVHANDLQLYSYVVGKATLTHEYPDFAELAGEVFLTGLPREERLAAVIAHLNARLEFPESYPEIQKVDTWFQHKYGEGGSEGRLYFGRLNALRIAVARHMINSWRLSLNEYCLLLSSLIQAADKVANVTMIYYAFLKKMKPTALKPLRLEVPRINPGLAATVYNLEAADFVQKAAGGNALLYIDPPYNERQYGGYYHLLETLAVWDDPPSPGKSGVRPWANKKSGWCSKKSAPGELAAILKLTDARWAMLSYSSEALMTDAQIRAVMGEHGEVHRFEHDVARLITKEGDDNRSITEYLYAVQLRA